MPPHIALLGDSVFDDGTYTAGAPDVVTHLRDLLPRPWDATLYAVDGTTTGDLESQIRSVRDPVTHLVVSVGGNDALLNGDMLNLPVGSTAEALDLFGKRLADFEQAHGHVLESLATLGRATTLCTIYNGNLAPPDRNRARVALAMFNDVIYRNAVKFEMAVIELRLVCNDVADFANPIEPSGAGGRKIATAVAFAVGACGTGRRVMLHAG